MWRAIGMYESAEGAVQGANVLLPMASRKIAMARTSGCRRPSPIWPIE